MKQTFNFLASRLDKPQTRQNINVENGKAMFRSISLIRFAQCLPKSPHGGTSRCNLPSLNPTQPSLRHCLPLHGRKCGRSSTPKSSVNISGKLPRVRRALGFPAIMSYNPRWVRLSRPPRQRRRQRRVSGVPVGDIPCYPKHEAVIPQHLPYVSAAMAGRTSRRTGTTGGWSAGAGSRSPDYHGDINHPCVIQLAWSQWICN